MQRGENVATGSRAGKRAYTFATRTQKFDEENALTKKRKVLLESLENEVLGAKHCCKTRHCFSSIEETFVRSEARRVLLMDSAGCRSFL